MSCESLNGFVDFLDPVGPFLCPELLSFFL